MRARKLLTINIYSIALLNVGFLLLITEKFTLTRFVHSVVCISYIVSLIAFLFFSRPVFRLWRLKAPRRSAYIIKMVGFFTGRIIVLAYAALLSLGLLLSYAHVKAKGKGYKVYSTGSFLSLPSYELYRYWYILEEPIGYGGAADPDNIDVFKDGKIISVRSGADSTVVSVSRNIGDTALIFYPRR